MATRPRPSPLATGGDFVFAFLSPFPVAFFTGALLTDLTYQRTAEMQWTNFSAWLITAGLFTGVPAVIGEVAAPTRSRLAGILDVVVLVLALFNIFVHSRDAYTSVVPTGLTLSFLTVLALLVAGWLHWSARWADYRRAY